MTWAQRCHVDPAWQHHHAEYLREDGTADEKAQRRRHAIAALYAIEAKYEAKEQQP